MDHAYTFDQTNSIAAGLCAVSSYVQKLPYIFPKRVCLTGMLGYLAYDIWTHVRVEETKFNKNWKINTIKTLDTIAFHTGASILLPKLICDTFRFHYLVPPVLMVPGLFLLPYVERQTHIFLDTTLRTYY